MSLVRSVLSAVTTAAIVMAAECAADSPVRAVDVFTQTPLSASGGDDLALMRGYFSGASWERPVSSQTWQLLQQVGISKFRLINVESPGSTHVDPASGALSFDFSNLLPGLQDCRRYSVTPHVIVGQFQQNELALRKGNVPSGMSDWSHYQAYAYAFLKFVTVDQGFGNAEFEVANEPDTNGASWLVAGKLPMADPKMFGAYIDLYGAWASAAAKLGKEHPELKFSIGGPDATAYSLGFGKFDWAKHFIQEVSRRKLRLDYFSFHYYGNVSALPGLASFGPYPSFDRMVQGYRTALKDSGQGDVPLYITEWGPSYVTDETPAGIINGNNIGAAWTARFAMTMADTGIKKALLLVLRDDPGVSGSAASWGWSALLLADGTTPKSLYNVARIFHDLTGQRVKTATDSSNLRALAAADSNKLGVLVFNQDWDFARARDRAPSQTITLRIDRLPFSSPRVRVTRFVIDATHSNARAFFQPGKSIPPASASLTQVDDRILPAMNNTVDLPQVEVAPSGLSYWKISPAPLNSNASLSEP